MREALTLKDYDVVTSETFESVAVVEKIAPDLLYLDISLVGQDGREISRELKGDTRTQHIPIVILTAYPNALDIAKEAGGGLAYSIGKYGEKTGKYSCARGNSWVDLSLGQRGQSL